MGRSRMKKFCLGPEPQAGRTKKFCLRPRPHKKSWAAATLGFYLNAFFISYSNPSEYYVHEGISGKFAMLSLLTSMIILVTEAFWTYFGLVIVNRSRRCLMTEQNQYY
jgi:hypothetical protein